MVIENKSIAIVGGGPGGLILARLLQLKGANVKVYERDINKDARVIGSPLDMHEESGLAALRKANLLDEFKKNFRPGADKMGTNCKLIVLSKQGWEELSRTIVGWDNIKNKMVQICMFQKTRKGPVISQDATTRYVEFLENHPSLANRIPLVYIASYLGVTEQSLSRIRKNIR